MDWIDVVVEMIDIKNVSKKNDNDSSIKVMTFIMCIDVMWEAVQQLHRIFLIPARFPLLITRKCFAINCFKPQITTISRLYEPVLPHIRSI